MRRHSGNISAVKAVLILLFILLFSCTKKDEGDCYICTTVYTTTTDIPVTGFPSIITDAKKLCDITPEEARTYEETYTITEPPLTIGGVTYSGYKTTDCEPE